MRSCITSL